MDSNGTAVGLELEDLKAIDTVRARLAQLVSSVSRLQGDVFMSNPLPPPESIQASAFVLQQNMASLNEVMTQHADLFRRIVVHPDPSFPGRTEEQVLTSLLRKKLEPDVEQMAEKARDKAEARGISLKSFDVKKPTRNDDDDDDEDDDEDSDNGDSDDEGDMFDGPRQPYGLGDIWYDARGWCINQITTFIQEEAAQNYTKAEREQGVESVRTGLKRSLDEEDEDDDDEDEEEDDDENKMDTRPAPAAAAPTSTPAVPPLEPELLLWFASRGDTNLPRYVDIESQRAAVLTGAQRRM